ncbi:ATP-binding cassette domain-containing protein [Cohnella sp. CFH 77786]|uniref:ABC transporter ATP-binding protein n=1 Tax=Cohnella sp. CFH 77786 TaxID=2662265 RepID=UPI001C608160|nr:ABC transporter ATP-binding protein [Cohnella sp. CFH 77786]MBW5445884.1 ATP-binding cassette domain-containing protein [Cohnella sp. CFH 77786]
MNHKDHPVIKINQLTKIYKIFDGPLDRLKEALHPFKKKYHKNFSALNSVSLEIYRGETIGIVGKNGSGKSTLLKLITGVLSPTSGQIMVNGKVSALLELGAGFNPEYTGMQNVYLNGTLMGYTKEEVDAKVDSILKFADIGDFIFQPVKSYSSGMFARLAFAVAINVEPDILIVDEALSVGDFVFQSKCYMKLQEMQKRGTTILLVSHSNQQIINYCTRAILLHEGAVIEDSHEVEKVIFKYEEYMRTSRRHEGEDSPYEKPVEIEYTGNQTNESVDEHRFGSHDAYIKQINVTHQADGWQDAEVLKSGHTCYFKIAIHSKKDIEAVVIGLSFKDVNGIVIWGDNSIVAGQNISLQRGMNYFSLEFNLNLAAGEYMLFLGLADISGAERVELDQRWPVKKISIVSSRGMAEGYVYAPTKFMVL